MCVPGFDGDWVAGGVKTTCRESGEKNSGEFPPDYHVLVANNADRAGGAGVSLASNWEQGVGIGHTLDGYYRAGVPHTWSQEQQSAELPVDHNDQEHDWPQRGEKM